MGILMMILMKLKNLIKVIRKIKCRNKIRLKNKFSHSKMKMLNTKLHVRNQIKSKMKLMKISLLIKAIKVNNKLKKTRMNNRIMNHNKDIKPQNLKRTLIKIN